MRADELRESAIRHERQRWTGNPCPLSKTHATSATLNSLSKDWLTATASLTAKAALISPLVTPHVMGIATIDRLKLPQAACYPALSNESANFSRSARKTQPKAEKMARELNEIQYEARADKAHAAAVSAVLGKARLLNIMPDEAPKPIDFAKANSMQDIGRKLLQSVGFASPDDASIQAAIEANDAFVGRLEAIRDAAQALTIDHDD
jgi:hypothetical protein